MTRNRWWEGAVPRFLRNGDPDKSERFAVLKDPVILEWVREGTEEGLPDEPDDNTMLLWINALEAIDERGDHRWLLKRLETCVPPEVFPHLADLFDRRELKLKRGQATRRPSYSYDGPEVALRIAKDHVKYLIDTDGLSLDDALTAVSKIQDIPLDLLTNAQRDRRGASRRA